MTDDILNEIVPIETQAQGLEVQDPEGLEKAGNLLTAIKMLRLKVAESFDPIIKKAHDAHKEALIQKRKHDLPLERAEGFLKPRIAAYMNAALSRQREEAEKAQAAERKRIEDQRMAEATFAEEVGDTMAADAILAAPVVVAPVEVEKPKVEGVSTRQVYDYEIVNADLIQRDYLTPDHAKIRKVVQAMGPKAGIQGITVTVRTVVAARAR